MTTGDLFGDTPVDWGVPRPSLKRARRLVAMVDGLEASIDTYRFDCWAARMLAIDLGAHSVARAVGWAKDQRTMDRHGPDAMFSRVERVARNWLARLEQQ